MSTRTLDTEEWFTLDDISESSTTETLYCISVDSPDKQFLIGEHIAVPTHNTDEGKEEDALKGEAVMIIGSVARLGRAAGVHLVIATQRPDATMIPGETKANLGVRINCGRTDSNASNMILGTGDGARVKANPRGRLFLRIYGNGDHGQGFFAQPSWIDDYLESKGLNQDGTRISGDKKSQLAKLVDMSQFSEGDLDSREGVDNSAVINKIRENESNNYLEEDDAFSEDNTFSSENDFTEDDDSFGFEEISESPVNDKLGRPELGTGGGNKDKFHRPEDDWDTELEDLIMENNS